MANIKISELNELTKSQTAYDDFIPVVDSSANETKKISVESLTANNVYLLAVVKPNGQVPAPVVGAKYYSEAQNKIYYALDDEHWYEYGTPIEGIFYVVLGEKGNYTYDADNEILVSVGGGSGSEIVIGDESETTEDTKLLVDTSGSTDELKYKDENTGTFKDLEVKALDSMPVGTIVDFDGTDIPTGWEEVEEYLWTNSNPTSNFASQNITLSDDNYNYYEVVYSQGTDNSVYLTTGKIPKGKGCFLQSVVGVSGGALVRGRTITYTNDTTLSVGDCRQAIGTSSASAQNEYLIPIYVRRYN